MDDAIKFGVSAAHSFMSLSKFKNLLDGKSEEFKFWAMDAYEDVVGDER